MFLFTESFAIWALGQSTVVEGARGPDDSGSTLHDQRNYADLLTCAVTPVVIFVTRPKIYWHHSQNRFSYCDWLERRLIQKIKHLHRQAATRFTSLSTSPLIQSLHLAISVATLDVLRVKWFFRVDSDGLVENWSASFGR